MMRDSPSPTSSSAHLSSLRFSYLSSSTFGTSAFAVVLTLLLIFTFFFLSNHRDSYSLSSNPFSSSSTSSSSSSSSVFSSSSTPSSSTSHSLKFNGGGGHDGGGGGAIAGEWADSLSDAHQQPVAASAPSPAPVSETTGFPNPRTDRASPDPKLGRIELDLARARAAISQSYQEVNRSLTLPDPEYVPKGPIYRNAYAFHRSYLEMEKLFRVYVYEEGEPPLFHDGPCNDIYSMEGRFIYNMDMETRLRTRDPERAHVHFLPFSVTKMVMYVFQRKDFNMLEVKRTIQDYVHVISQRYPYWNRSLGADHFMVSCHDWGPRASAALPHLYSNSIRVLCNANTSEGFNPAKDVSLPEMNLKVGVTTGIIGGPSASKRPVLAFFAGGVHGPIRPVLLEHWKGKDEDVQVHEYLPQGVSYYDMMRKSKYCICPSGYEVASPRIVEAIYLECVPVIISDHYALPFFDVLDWKAFSVQLAVEDIPDLKRILMGISPREYVRMQRRVRAVQRHFVVNTPPKRFDIFHMILHSVWLRRMNLRLHPQE